MFESASASCSYQDLNPKRTSGSARGALGLGSAAGSHVQVKVEECTAPEWLGCAYRYGMSQLGNCGVLALGTPTQTAEARKDSAAKLTGSDCLRNRYLAPSAFSNIPPSSPFGLAPTRGTGTSSSSGIATPSSSSSSSSSATPHGLPTDAPRTDDADKRVPPDPMRWTEVHVKLWVQWAVKEFGLRELDPARFTCAGSELCRLSRDDFNRATNPQIGEILYAHLTFLRQTSENSSSPRDKSTNPTSPTNGSLSKPYSLASTDTSSLRLTKTEPSYKNAWGSHTASQTQAFSHNSIHAMSKPAIDAHAHPHLRQDPYQMFGPTSSRLASSGSGQIQLWQFLLELLSDSSNANCITWEGTNGEFKLTDPDEVARRWGERKSKPNMNYDKLSRALRYYYDKNIMTKVHGKRYAYKFDFQGLAAATQPAATDPAAYKYQSDLFMSGYHASPKLNFVGAHTGISSSTGGIFPSPTSYWTNPGANLYSNIAAASTHPMTHHPSHVTSHIGSYPHYA